MKESKFIPILSSLLLAATLLPASAQQGYTPMQQYNGYARDSWSWTKTKADQGSSGETLLPVTYSNTGTLNTGLNPTSGSSSSFLRQITGPARIDNGLPELPPEPYASRTGTSYAYNVPSSYTGVFGLYGGDVSAYAAMSFPNAMNVYSGSYTQSLVDSYFTDGGYAGFAASRGLDLATYPNLHEAVSASVFELSLGSVDPRATEILFQLRIVGLGPTVANVLNGTFLSTYDVVQQMSPISLVYNGTESLSLTSAQLVSYVDLGTGSRHSYAGGSLEETWEFRWDLSGVVDPISNYSITFGNYPTSVISGLAVSQIPEPSTWALLAAGGLLGLRRRFASRK